MSTNIVAINGKVISQVIVGLGAGLFALAVISGVKLPFIASDRVALVGLLVIGMAFCGLGMEIDTYGWLNPINIAGSVIGAAMLGLVIAAFAGLHLPFLSTDRAVFLVVTLVGVLKVVIGALRPFLFHS